MVISSPAGSLLAAPAPGTPDDPLLVRLRDLLLSLNLDAFYGFRPADNLAPEYYYSDRDQRHRFNAWLLVTARGFDFNTRISSRTAQPRSVGDTPQDRIQADGSIIKRNTLRKDNEFFTWDFRVGRPFNVTGSVRLEPVFEVFNLTNNKNIRRPEVTSLIFNFDGTVQSGLGEPRQAQLGLRVRF